MVNLLVFESSSLDITVSENPTTINIENKPLVSTRVSIFSVNDLGNGVFIRFSKAVTPNHVQPRIKISKLVLSMQHVQKLEAMVRVGA